MNSSFQPRRAVVCAVGSGGDVLPFIEIAAALARRGLDTTLLAPSRYRQHAAGRGIHYLSIGADEVFDDVFGKPGVWTVAHGLSESWRYYGAALRTGLEKLRDGWDPRDTVLVGSSFALATRLAGELDGFRDLTVHLSPSVIWSAERPPRWPAASIPPAWPKSLRRLAMALAEEAFVDPVLRRAVNPVRRELGLAPVRRVFSRYVHGARVAYAFPEWFAPAAADWPADAQFAGFVLPPRSPGVPAPGIARFLAAGQPLAVVTAGTAVATRPAWVERASMAAVEEMYRVIVVSPDPAPVRHPDVLTLPYAPFDALLPRARIIVHHGGIGTMAEAMRAGVIQVAVPGAHDQPDNAERLQRLGAGIRAAADTSTAGFRFLLRQAVTPERAVAAQRLRDRMNGQEDAAGTIAALALALPLAARGGR